MLAFDRDALMCDMAETYGIYDIKAFRPKQVAMYACGLSPDSRIYTKMSGIHPRHIMEILAHIVDELQIMRYSLTAQKGDSLPTLFTDLIMDGEGHKSKEATQGFRSGEEFDEAWKNLAKGGDNNG